MDIRSEELYDEIALILKKLFMTIYELENGDLTNNVVMEEDFQIQKLVLRPGNYLPHEEEQFPAFLYRDNEGNEIIITNQNIISIRLKDKKTIYGSELKYFKEESDFLENVVMDLNSSSSKVLVKN